MSFYKKFWSNIISFMIKIEIFLLYKSELLLSKLFYFKIINIHRVLKFTLRFISDEFGLHKFNGLQKA